MDTNNTTGSPPLPYESSPTLSSQSSNNDTQESSMFGPQRTAKTRRSCDHCRFKKVKCSGEPSGCVKCKALGLACVYDRAAPVGRPAKNAVVNKMLALRPKGSGQNIFVLENLNSYGIGVLQHTHWLTQEKMTGGTDGAESGVQTPRTLSEHLKTIFSNYFDDKPPGYEPVIDVGIVPSELERLKLKAPIQLYPNIRRMQLGSGDMAGLEEKELQKVAEAASQRLELRMLREPAPNLMMHDMIDMIVYKLSSLEVTRMFSGPARYIHGLRMDKSTSFFDKTESAHTMPNPLKSLAPQQALQLIDLWFYLHPFQNILNKTSTLQQFWTDQGDPLLYSAIFASAALLGNIPDTSVKTGVSPLDPLATSDFSPSPNDQVEHFPGSIFLAHAFSILESTTTTQPTLQKLQAIIILSWHTHIVNNPKRGTALMAFAFYLCSVMGIPNQDSPNSPHRRCLHPLELELRANCWWTLITITLWGCLQIDQPPRIVLANLHSIKLPVPSEDLSESYKLDTESGNVAPFRHQAHSIRYFSTCARVGEVVKKIWLSLPAKRKNYFHPSHVGDPTEDNDRNVDDKLEVGGLGVTGENPLIAKIVGILSEWANAIPNNLDPTASSSSYLVYHTLVIHAHFPRASHFTTTPPPPTPQTYITALQHTNPILSRASEILSPTSSIEGIIHPLVVFGLDTCSKCFERILSDSVNGTDRGAITAQMRQTCLAGLVTVYRMLKNDNIEANTKPVKRAVKALLKTWGVDVSGGEIRFRTGPGTTATAQPQYLPTTSHLTTTTSSNISSSSPQDPLSNIPSLEDITTQPFSTSFPSFVSDPTAAAPLIIHPTSIPILPPPPTQIPQSSSFIPPSGSLIPNPQSESLLPLSPDLETLLASFEVEVAGSRLPSQQYEIFPSISPSPLSSSASPSLGSEDSGASPPPSEPLSSFIQQDKRLYPNVGGFLEFVKANGLGVDGTGEFDGANETFAESIGQQPSAWYEQGLRFDYPMQL